MCLIRIREKRQQRLPSRGPTRGKFLPPESNPNDGFPGFPSTVDSRKKKKIKPPPKESFLNFEYQSHPALHQLPTTNPTLAGSQHCEPPSIRYSPPILGLIYLPRIVSSIFGKIKAEDLPIYPGLGLSGTRDTYWEGVAHDLLTF